MTTTEANSQPVALSEPEEEKKSAFTDSGRKLSRRVQHALSKFDIGHLLLALLGLHLFAMSFPNGSTDYVFDESYYVPAAEKILQGVASNLEHPFFGKIWGALGISLFGSDFFGYRIFYVIIGLLAVWTLYHVALNFVSKEKALLAAAFLGFETLFFIHTSLLLLEGPPIFFALVGFLAYFKKRYYLSALAMGLSVLSKEWGVYFVLALLLYHLYAMPKHDFPNVARKNAIQLAIFIAIMVLVFALPMWVYDIVYKPVDVNFGPITNPILNFRFYFFYQSLLTGCQSTTAWNCYPWNWIIPLHVEPSNYYIVTNTVTTTLPSGKVLTTTTHPIDWVGIGNLVVWLAVWPITIIIAYKAATRKLTKADVFVGAWIAATYLPWYYVSLVLHRVEYSFYFINTDPALALGIPLVVSFLVPDSSKRVQNAILLVWLFAALYFFALFFPVKP
ncbi:MAG: glycosyltransferase family 39 protein [Nitrososphaerales archaeon]